MKIGVLGGGQLGMMLGHAAKKIGHECVFFDPSPKACAQQVGELINGAYDDEAAIVGFADSVDVVTYEFENVLASAAEVAGEHAPVRPGLASLRQTQDRLLERRLLQACWVPVARYEPVDGEAALGEAIEAVGVPGILKRCRGGYDGKGQFRIDAADQIGSDAVEAAEYGCIYERRVPFFRELSVVGSRDSAGNVVIFPVVESVHEQGILVRTTSHPSLVSEPLTAQAREYFAAVVHKLEHVGTLAIELFETEEGLVANEVAPRVHNTGHWTIEGCRVSQFENHVRAITGMGLIDPADAGCRCSVMLNVIGAEPDLGEWAGDGRVAVHRYGKSPKPGRKIGHVTVVGDNPEDTISLADTVDARIERVLA